MANSANPTVYTKYRMIRVFVDHIRKAQANNLKTCMIQKMVIYHAKSANLTVYTKYRMIRVFVDHISKASQ